KKDKEEDPDKLIVEEKRALVSVFVAKDTLFNHYLELQGSVDTKENIIINAEFGGNLTSVSVQEGQKVTKGDELAKIDDGGLARQLSQAKAQSSLAYTTYKRQKRLWEQKIGSEIEYLQAQTSYQTKLNTVQQLEAQLSRARIKAPFTGTIDEIFAEQGTVVSPGTPVMRIVNLDSMYIEAEVPEKYIKGIRDSIDVTVNFPILNKEIRTKIKQVSDFINPASRSFKITVDIPPDEAQGIKPNLTARLKINDYTNPNAILIPQDIISEDAQGRQYVYVVNLYNAEGAEDPVAKKVFIKTGETQEDLIEALDGIKEDNIIIKEGARNVKDGQKVKVII
ncbi:MAG: efflux RND transporter periplasmic adaptor subunit, partial [Sinomicrobium sp.]|nr:efflux RND transporter periplasmic adaptor subunit [Sinomicrobium sp.]